MTQMPPAARGTVGIFMQDMINFSAKLAGQVSPEEVQREKIRILLCLKLAENIQELCQTWLGLPSFASSKKLVLFSYISNIVILNIFNPAAQDLYNKYSFKISVTNSVSDQMWSQFPLIWVLVLNGQKSVFSFRYFYEFLSNCRKKSDQLSSFPFDFLDVLLYFVRIVPWTFLPQTHHRPVTVAKLKYYWMWLSHFCL